MWALKIIYATDVFTSKRVTIFTIVQTTSIVFKFKIEYLNSQTF